MSARPAFHADHAVAAVIVGFCALVYVLTAYFDEVPAAIAQGMGPAAFPRLVLAVMAALALGLAFASRGQQDESRERLPATFHLTVLAVAAFMGLVTLAGMVVAMFCAVVGIGRVWGERRWWLLALSGVGTAASIRLLFVNGFGIRLPPGWLGF
jgi:putative tricarboxylic transport membrane protein